MDIKLVKQLMEDNNLFKPANSDDQKQRKEAEDSVLKAKLASFKVGTKVKVKDDANIDPYRRDNKGLNGVVSGGVVSGNDPYHIFVHYPIKVIFPDREQKDVYTVDWFAPEELELI